MVSIKQFWKRQVTGEFTGACSSLVPTPVSMSTIPGNKAYDSHITDPISGRPRGWPQGSSLPTSKNPKCESQPLSNTVCQFSGNLYSSPRSIWNTSRPNLLYKKDTMVNGCTFTYLKPDYIVFTNLGKKLNRSITFTGLK